MQSVTCSNFTEKVKPARIQRDAVTQRLKKEVHVMSGRQQELTAKSERTKKPVRYLCCPPNADEAYSGRQIRRPPGRRTCESDGKVRTRRSDGQDLGGQRDAPIGRITAPDRTNRTDGTPHDQIGRPTADRIGSAVHIGWTRSIVRVRQIGRLAGRRIGRTRSDGPIGRLAGRRRQVAKLRLCSNF